MVIATRLCDAAEGAQILCADLVRALAGSRGAGHLLAAATELPVVLILDDLHATLDR